MSTETDEKEQPVQQTDLGDLIRAKDYPVTKKTSSSASNNQAVVSDAVNDVEIFEAFRKVTHEKSELQIKLRKEEAKNETRGILDSLIIPLASKTFIFMCAYCAVVAVLLVCSGLSSSVFQYFLLEESTLNFLVGSTATTVVGLVGMVVTGVFLGGNRK